MAYNLSFNPVWSMQDLNGLQLDDSYYLFTLSNTLPYLYSPIFKDQDATISWSDPIQFLANGSLPTNLYWDDEVVYRLEVRQGNTQSDPLIYLIENYVPVNGSAGPTPPQPGNNSTDNLITNPQFEDVLFQVPTLMTSSTSPINFAPGWQIVTTGAGTISIQQLTLAGDAGVDTNPSYYISIANNGFNTVTLQQTFAKNGALWTREAAAASITARATSPTNISVQLKYSDNTTSLPLISKQLQTGWNTYRGAVDIPGSTNTTSGINAFTNLNLSWEGNVTVLITSIQLIGQDVMDPTVTYAQIPIERQIDHEFHYYKPKLEYKPIPSYAIGWDFGFNPCQALGPTPGLSGLAANRARYVADQTISFESVGNVMSYAFDKTGVSITTTTATQFALIQYLDAPTAVELLNQRLSVSLRGNIASGTIVGDVQLYWTDSTLPVINDSVIVSLTAGIPTIAAGWSQVNRGVLNAAQFTLTTTNQSFGFNGFDATTDADINTATFFAIVVSFNALPISTALHLDYISLCGGDIATRPAPLSQAQTLAALQYYYEKSYNNNAYAGNTGDNGELLRNMQFVFITGSGTNGQFISYPTYFDISFNTIKRTSSPTVKIYSSGGGSSGADGTVNYIYIIAGASGSGVVSGIAPSASPNWTVITSSKDATFTPALQTLFFNSNVSAISTFNSAIIFQYTCDARLGVVL